MSRKRRVAVKSRGILSTAEKAARDKAILFNEVKKNANKVNARLRSLNRAGFKTGTWASKKLADRLGTNLLNSYNKKSGRVKLRKNATTRELTTINKSLVNFLNSETSTKKGIKGVRERTIKSLSKTLSDFDNEVSYDEAEALYNMLEDKDFTNIVEQIGASEAWALFDESIEQDESESEFIIKMQAYLPNVKDNQRLYNRLSRLYEKYIS